MNRTIQAAILIPSLEPDDRLPAYVDKLCESGFRHVVIVDDGSSEKFQPIFDDLERREGVVVLHHDVNHGKGVALKTGYAYIAEHLPDCPGVITADADGQHTVPDCIKLADALETGKRALYLGSRDFSLPCIPPKSRFGNRCTSVVFKLFYGVWLPDTQTGLRAFRREDLDFMRNVEGERYEYEMNVLIACARASLPMETITIETVYENNNEGTHFHPLRDSWRIYKVILGGFFRFAGVSILSWLLDEGLANLLFYVLLPLLGVAGAALEFVSGYGARLVSAVFNYTMNRKLVFKSDASVAASAWKYVILALGIITVSNICVWVLGLIGVPYALAKILIDLVLYLVSYNVQDRWVFKPAGQKGAQA